MSKPNSGHFKGSTGHFHSPDGTYLKEQISAIMFNNGKGLDLREHPTKRKQLSSKKQKILREKLKNRTITMDEYKHLRWQQRLDKRRKKGIKLFWDHEIFLIKNNLPTTRNWSAQQRADILNNKRPKYKNVTMQSHHTYSVAKYPHLANIGKLIYPVTKFEHIQGWHGGNPQKSLPGKPIKNIKEF